MALTHFYVQSGGSDLNAGSTTSNSASLSYAGGTFVRATGVFTVASGNPLSDGVLVNDYASIYTTSGATTTAFVSKVTARDATTVTVDLTNAFGIATAVSQTAAAVTLKVGGAHASLLPWGTFSSATTLGATVKVNIKAATYTVTASLTIAMGGITTFPIWFSGYNTTPGDLDADTTNALAKPVFAANATFSFIMSGSHHLWSGVSFTGNRSGSIVFVSGGSWKGYRLRVENTSSNAAAVALILSPSASGAFLLYSWCKCPTTATTTGVIQATAEAEFIGVLAEGGGVAGFNLTAAAAVSLRECIGLNNTGNGVLCNNTGLSFRLDHCTIVNSSASGVGISATPTSGLIVATLFATCGAYGINNATGTNTARVIRASNAFYNCASGHENGFGDFPSPFDQTESTDPLTSGSDPTPAIGALARNQGFPGVFENEAFTSYADIGAVRHQDAGGTGAGYSRGRVVNG